MFQLTDKEYESIGSQFVTTSGRGAVHSSQTVMSSRKHRGRRYRPYAFTEQGVAMLSSVLRSSRAVEVNIAIMRTFVQQFAVVFEAIKELITPPSPSKKRIGFHP